MVLTVRFLVNLLGFERGDVVEFEGDADGIAELELYVTSGMLERV